MRVFTAEYLRGIASELLEAAGTSPTNARLIGDSLIDANLAGHDSHGILRLPAYLQAVASGRLNASVDPQIVSQCQATAVIDAGYGWGQTAMWLATKTAIKLAEEFGIAAAAVQRCFHIGRVAPYVESVASNGMIGIAMANAAPAVAPYGGTQRILGTNPIAWAAPRADGKPPICLDIATSQLAEGKLRVARAKGETIAPGVIVDRDGTPSVDPHDFYDGGALLAFGGHKGSGISMLAQLVGRGLAGLDPSGMDGPRGVNGPFIIAINISPFAPLAHFLEQTEAQCRAVKESAPAVEFDEVLLPGEPEVTNREKREENGIPIAEATWEELLQVASEFGVRIDEVGKDAIHP
jgi:LDH2 family malate/lactate/ureidoglycolate dehydrogenase